MLEKMEKVFRLSSKRIWKYNKGGIAMKKYRGAYLVTILILLVVLGYALFINRNTGTSEENNTNLNEIDILTTRDLSTNYPNTPNKVIDFYSRIMKCYYSEGYEDDTIEKLVKQSMLLFDDELLEQNPYEELLENTKEEIENFKEADRRITNYIIGSSGDVKYYSEDDKDYAVVRVKYLLRDISGYGESYEQYMLRKDENGNWKILGWEMTPESERDDD